MALQATTIHTAFPEADDMLQAVVDAMAEHAPQDTDGVQRILLATDESMKLMDLYEINTLVDIMLAFAPLRRMSKFNEKVRVVVMHSALWPGIIPKTESDRDMEPLTVPEALAIVSVLQDMLPHVQRHHHFESNRYYVEAILAVCQHIPRGIEFAGPEIIEFLDNCGAMDSSTKHSKSMALCCFVATKLFQSYVPHQLSYAVQNYEMLFHAVLPQGPTATAASIKVLEEVGGQQVRELIGNSIYIPPVGLKPTGSFVPVIPPVFLAMKAIREQHPPIEAIFQQLMRFPKLMPRDGLLLETICARWLWFIGRCANARGVRLTLADVFLDVLGPSMLPLLKKYDLNVHDIERYGIIKLTGVICLQRHLECLLGKISPDRAKSPTSKHLQTLFEQDSNEATTLAKRMEHSREAAHKFLQDSIDFMQSGETLIIMEDDALDISGRTYNQPGMDVLLFGSGSNGPVGVFLEPHPQSGSIEAIAEAIEKKLDCVSDIVKEFPTSLRELQFGLLILTDADLRDSDIEKRLHKSLRRRATEQFPVVLGIADQQSLRAFVGPWAPLYDVALKSREVRNQK